MAAQSNIRRKPYKLMTTCSTVLKHHPIRRVSTADHLAGRGSWGVKVWSRWDVGKLLATRRARTGSAVGIDRDRTASVDRWKSCALPLLTLTIDDQPDSSVVPQASSSSSPKRIVMYSSVGLGRFIFLRNRPSACQVCQLTLTSRWEQSLTSQMSM